MSKADPDPPPPMRIAAYDDSHEKLIKLAIARNRNLSDGVASMESADRRSTVDAIEGHSGRYRPRREKQMPHIGCLNLKDDKSTKQDFFGFYLPRLQYRQSSRCHRSHIG